MCKSRREERKKQLKLFNTVFAVVQNTHNNNKKKHKKEKPNWNHYYVNEIVYKMQASQLEFYAVQTKKEHAYTHTNDKPLSITSNVIWRRKCTREKKPNRRWIWLKKRQKKRVEQRIKSI